MKYSVVTINYNNREGLARTLESVRRQSDRNFQYIVIDGGSSDGSAELIARNEDIIDFWVSEPDGGIYNAMNKGVAKATGNHTLFLNSGDCFHSDSVMEKMNALSNDADILFGRVLNIFPGGKTKLYVPASEMSLMWILRTGIHHAGSFIRTSLMRKYPYDESLKICADRKFFIQALVIDNCSFFNLDFTVCDFEMDGVSNSDPKKVIDEYWLVMSQLFPPRLVDDYRKSDERIQQMTARLVKCRHRIVSLVCAIDIFIINFFKLILGRKSQIKSR